LPQSAQLGYVPAANLPSSVGFSPRLGWVHLGDTPVGPPFGVAERLPLLLDAVLYPFIELWPNAANDYLPYTQGFEIV
jgi:hypothetical protein